MVDTNGPLPAIELDGHMCGSTASLPDGRRDRSCPQCIEERDQQWSEALAPTCLAEFTPGIAAEFVKALEEAAEREKARADRAERDLDTTKREIAGLQAFLAMLHHRGLKDIDLDAWYESYAEELGKANV